MVHGSARSYDPGGSIEMPRNWIVKSGCRSRWRANSVNDRFLSPVASSKAAAASGWTVPMMTRVSDSEPSTGMTSSMLNRSRFDLFPVTWIVASPPPSTALLVEIQVTELPKENAANRPRPCLPCTGRPPSLVVPGMSFQLSPTIANDVSARSRFIPLPSSTTRMRSTPPRPLVSTSMLTDVASSSNAFQTSSQRPTGGVLRGLRASSSLRPPGSQPCAHPGTRNRLNPQPEGKTSTKRLPHQSVACR